MFDLSIADAVARLHFDGVLLARTQIFGTNLQDAVGVYQESHLDAWQPGRGWRHFQREPSERTAVFCQFALALQDVNVDARLIVNTRRVKLLRARRNR